MCLCELSTHVVTNQSTIDNSVMFCAEYMAIDSSLASPLYPIPCSFPYLHLIQVHGNSKSAASHPNRPEFLMARNSLRRSALEFLRGCWIIFCPSSVTAIVVLMRFVYFLTSCPLNNTINISPSTSKTKREPIPHIHPTPTAPCHCVMMNTDIRPNAIRYELSATDASTGVCTKHSTM